MKQYLHHFDADTTETYGSGALQMIKVSGCSIEGDQIFPHNTREIFDNGTLSDLYATVDANSYNASCTIRSIKGVSSYTDGNLIVTFGAAATGTLSDTSNTDDVTANESWTWEFDSTGASSGSLTLSEMAHLWDPDSGSITLCGAGGPSSIGISAVGTSYVCIFGLRNTSTTESQARSINSAPGTWKNLSVGVVGTAASAVTITWTARINGSDGNQTVTFDETASQEHIQDTSNTDTLASGDNMGWEIDCTEHSAENGHDTESVFSQIDSTGDADYTQIMTGGARQIVPNSNAVYFPAAGINDESATESDTQHTILMAATASNLANYFSQNSGSGDSVTTLRIDGADGNQVVNFNASGTPGGAVDSSNTDTLAADDLLSVEVTVSSGNIRLQALAMTLTEITSSTEAGAGSASGTATVSGIGATIAAAAGSAAGQAAVAGIASAIAAGAGASAGTATVSGAGSTDATQAGAGTVNAQAVAAGVAAAIHAGVGAVMAQAAASGAGEATAAAAGASAAQAVASGVAAAVAAGIGSIAGTAQAEAVGATIAAAAGTAAGQATVSGAGSQDGVVAGVGTATGSATVSAVGSAISSGIGSAAAVATVSGASAEVRAAAGSAAAQAAANGIAAMVAAALGQADAAATVGGVSSAVAAAAGTVTAQAVAAGVITDVGAVTVPQANLAFTLSKASAAALTLGAGSHLSLTLSEV